MYPQADIRFMACAWSCRFADSLAEVPGGGSVHRFDVSDDDLMPVKLPVGHDYTSTPSLCSELKTSIVSVSVRVNP